jgi:integrase/recombinase XerD
MRVEFVHQMHGVKEAYQVVLTLDDENSRVIFGSGIILLILEDGSPDWYFYVDLRDPSSEDKCRILEVMDKAGTRTDQRIDDLLLNPHFGDCFSGDARRVADGLGRLMSVANGVPALPKAEMAYEMKRSVAAFADNFLDEKRLCRRDKTWRGYRIALAYFLESCRKPYLEDIERMDLLRFSSFLKIVKKQSPRSVHNKFACVLTFLYAQGLTTLVGKNDRPRFVDKQVEIYEDGELEKLSAFCSDYHRTLYGFLLMTGLREKEAMYCIWDDVNFGASTISVRWKARYDFTPKAYREREIPIPTKLVKILTVYKTKTACGSGLIFHTASGLPDTHMLRALKRNAARAGLNPRAFWIHKFRSSFATLHLRGGADLLSVQAWLGHTTLESTIRYLKPARACAMLDRVNTTFQ